MCMMRSILHSISFISETESLQSATPVLRGYLKIAVSFEEITDMKGTGH